MEAERLELDLPYQVYLGHEILGNMPKFINTLGYSKLCLLVDERVRNLLLDSGKAQIPKVDNCISIEAIEGNKNIETYLEICKKLLGSGVDRYSMLLIMGGGVMGDIGAFVASTYMRGIPFILIPTTLLSQADSCIGGKTGVNFQGIKNFLGTFTSPSAVFIDTSCLSNLSCQEMRNGFAEMIKHAFIGDENYFSLLKEFSSKTQEPLLLLKLIEHSLKIKSDIIAEDPFEQGPRKLLNFGHTIGHALEALALEKGQLLPHGEAVSLGMVAEAKISVERGLLDSEVLHLLEEILCAYKLPIRCEWDFAEDQVLKSLTLDKKNYAGRIRFTLLNGLGHGIFDIEVNEAGIRTGLSYIRKTV